MILRWPLTTSTEIAHVLRPGSDLRPDSALRALRDKGWAAAPISVVPRSHRGAHGRAVWYSTLALDAARSARLDDEKAALALHVASHRLAAHRSARAVAELLLRAGPHPDPAALDEASGGALTRLATLTESARRKQAAHLGVQTVTGRISRTDGHSATVVGEDGTELSLPRTGDLASVEVGALLSVDVEPLPGGSTTLWVRAAFDSDADPHARRPSGIHLLSPAERDRLDPPVTATR